MTSDQKRTMIAGIREEEGEGGGEINTDKGVGRSKTEKEAGEGRQQQGHGSEDTVTSNSYLPADPRLVEVHNYGTVVQSTGAERSSSQNLAVDNPPCSQHLRGGTSQGKEGGRRRKSKA